MAKVYNELKNYKNVPRELVFDKALSDRARFVYVFMACKPNDWNFFLEPMAKEIGYSVDTLRKYINELIKSGWVEKGEQQTEKGKFGATEYVIKATKKTDTENFRHGELPTRKNPDTENFRHGENPTLTNIDNKQNNDFNKEKDSEKEIGAVAPTPKKTLEERERIFREEADKYRQTYGDRIIDEFLTYWTEPTPGRKRMRFEGEKTWEMARRISTWFKNDKKFNHGNGKSNDPDAAREQREQEIATLMQKYMGGIS